MSCQEQLISLITVTQLQDKNVYKILLEALVKECGWNRLTMYVFESTYRRVPICPRIPSVSAWFCCITVSMAANIQGKLLLVLSTCPPQMYLQANDLILGLRALKRRLRRFL